jgi:hypothetical protein
MKKHLKMLRKYTSWKFIFLVFWIPFVGGVSSAMLVVAKSVLWCFGNRS